MGTPATRDHPFTDEDVQLSGSAATYGAQEPGSVTTVIAASASQGKSAERDPSEAQHKSLYAGPISIRPYLNIKPHALCLNRSGSLKSARSAQDTDVQCGKLFNEPAPPLSHRLPKSTGRIPDSTLPLAVLGAERCVNGVWGCKRLTSEYLGSVAISSTNRHSNVHTGGKDRPKVRRL